MNWSASQLVAATGGRLEQDSGRVVTSVSTDSRTIAAGALFVPLVGPNFDGHQFLGAVADTGAAAVLVADGFDGELPTETTVVRVADTLAAFGDLASAWLKECGPKVVAITGSNGKTGTKEMTASVLAAYGRTVSTTGNHNNLVGVPQTIFRVQPHTEFLVLEMGMNAPGEIARLTEIADPDVGVVVSIGEAHLEGLGSIPGVVRAKGELYDGLRADASAVVNTIDKYVVKAARNTSARVLTVGVEPECDVSVSRIQRQGIGGFQAALRIAGVTHSLGLRAVGKHEVWNASLAVATTVALGLEPRAGIAALHRYEGVSGRLAWRVVRGVNIIDDTYNANPASMRAALRALAELGGSGRRIAVLGDMLELGRKADQLHRDVGVVAADLDVDVLYAVGRHNEDYATGFYGDKVVCAEDASEITAHLRQLVQPGDWVLVKGSRGMRMERVVRALAEEGGA